MNERNAARKDPAGRPDLSRPVALLAGLAGIAVVGIADATTGAELALSIFYVGPVGLAAWKGGRGVGLTATAAAGVSWFAAERVAGAEYSAAWIPYWNAGVRGAVFATVAMLAAALSRSLAKERLLARTDSLTGVSNSRHFGEAAEHERARATRYGRALTLAYIDLDNFKRVNDELGHSRGDEVLVTVAGHIRESVRRTDLVGRLGGDEFAVLLIETGADVAEQALEGIRSRLAARLGEEGLPVTLSIGAVAFTEPPDSVDAMISAADALMYTVKQSTKDRVVVETR